MEEAIRALDRLGTELPRVLAERLVPVVEGLIRDGIQAGRDPDGVPWPANRDGSRPLAGIEKYIRVASTGTTITVNLEDTAGYHQTGTSTLPQRKMVPDRNLPAGWETAIQAVVDEVVGNGLTDLR
jgi:hypothetical protein